MCLPCRVRPGATGARGGARPHRDTAARTPDPGTCAHSWTGSPVLAVQDDACLAIISETGCRGLVPLTTAMPDSAQASRRLSVPSQRLRRVPSPGVVLYAYQTRAHESCDRTGFPDAGR